ncbi:type IV pilus modification protein PilV [Glaciecola sp. SC05]|uniref:type IV pilus modification protein PilV n=1 Tax=Glaciecola sp. SC05 TaxID=1987355 RepID=UPI0035276262
MFKVNTKTRFNEKGRALKQQRGIGMVEVLITLFILSIGLLGVASMQFVGSFSNKDALSRTQAVMVAQQMSERLRASVVPSQFSDGFVVSNEYFDAANYNFSASTCSGNPYQCNCLTLPATVPDCQSNDCSANQVAQFDAHQMSCAAVESNPNARILVDCDDNNLADADACTAGSIHTITVSWPSAGWQDGNRVANTNCNASGQSSEDCVIIRVAL